VHDELVFEAPKHEAETLCTIVRDVMETAPEPARMGEFLRRANATRAKDEF